MLMHQSQGVVLELTVAGPGIGISNFEVQFREAGKAQLHHSLLRTSIHCSRGDSGQNETGRMKPCIGEAMIYSESLQCVHFNL